MTARTFWLLYRMMYRATPLYSECRGCSHEAGHHDPDCPVLWFERTFFKPEFRHELEQLV